MLNSVVQIMLMKHLINSLVRVEKKVDELIRLKISTSSPGSILMVQPLNYKNQSACPLCQGPVYYKKVKIPIQYPEGSGLEKEVTEEVFVRVCNCAPVDSKKE